jgi:hypothetical protein
MEEDLILVSGSSTEPFWREAGEVCTGPTVEAVVSGDSAFPFISGGRHGRLLLPGNIPHSSSAPMPTLLLQEVPQGRTQAPTLQVWKQPQSALLHPNEHSRSLGLCG